MYLTTTLPALPTTSSNYSLQTISLQRKPLPPLPIPQQRQQTQQNQYIQQRDQQYSSRTQQQQQKSNIQYYTEHHHQQQQPQQQQSMKSSSSSKNSSSIISQDVSLLEQVPSERVYEFAAHMTCFLWFGDYLMDSSSIIAPPPPPGGNGHRRYAEYKPRDAFKKFCKDVISATQVSNSVILLSLLYIHRMKMNNPTIKGQSGSEYRTFTVALMLANKFLDDNTYTNKTWSEVTNIPVSEINTMEMEFLSSLEYELYVSEQQYFEWVRKSNSFIALDEKKLHDDNNKGSDCSMQQVQYNSQSYLSSQSSQSQSNQSNQSNNQRQILVPVQSTGFKRSAEQAFVDGMMVSPPKRTNVYPVYSSQQQLVVQSSQPQYARTLSYPTPPPSSTGTSQVTYYNNLPTSTSSLRAVQHAHFYPMTTYLTTTARRMQSSMQSSFINARSTSSGFSINNLSLSTAVI